jgi:hypothetical protein
MCPADHGADVFAPARCGQVSPSNRHLCERLKHHRDPLDDGDTWLTLVGQHRLALARTSHVAIVGERYIEWFDDGYITERPAGCLDQDMMR